MHLQISSRDGGDRDLGDDGAADAVVIGAGVNGLAARCIWPPRGWSVDGVRTGGRTGRRGEDRRIYAARLPARLGGDEPVAVRRLGVPRRLRAGAGARTGWPLRRRATALPASFPDGTLAGRVDRRCGDDGADRGAVAPTTPRPGATSAAVSRPRPPHLFGLLGSRDAACRSLACVRCSRRCAQRGVRATLGHDRGSCCVAARSG